MTDCFEPMQRGRSNFLTTLFGKAASVVLVLGIAGCAAVPRASDGKTAAAAGTSTSTIDVMRNAVAPGLFELVYANSRLYATSAGDDRRNGEPGHIVVIDPDKLIVLESIESPEKPFALAANHQTNTLYVGHSMDRRVSVYDMKTMERKAVIQLEGADATGKAYRSRQLLVDESTNTVYVSSPAADGPVWIIDGASMTVSGTIPGAGGPGLALDEKRNRLYTSGRGFWTTIDRDKSAVLTRHVVQDKPERFLVNIDVDANANRAFATDSKHGELLVLDPDSGSVTKLIPTGAGAMAVKVNEARNEVYVSNRQAGTVSVVDARELVVKHSISTPPFPNSFVLGSTPAEVFVSIKQSRDPKSDGYRDDKKESIARISM